MAERTAIQEDFPMKADVSRKGDIPSHQAAIGGGSVGGGSPYSALPVEEDQAYDPKRFGPIRDADSMPDYVPKGYVPLGDLAGPNRGFYEYTKRNYSKKVHIFLDEPCPVWFEMRSKLSTIKLMPRTEYEIVGLDFITWFSPEYQLHFEEMPASVLAMGMSEYEWSRQRLIALQLCNRDVMLKGDFELGKKPPLYKNIKGLLETNQQYDVWNKIPMVFVGVAIKRITVTRSSQPLHHVVWQIMKDQKIPFAKSQRNEKHLDIVVDFLRPQADLFALGDLMEGHAKTGREKPIVDSWIAGLLDRAAILEEGSKKKEKLPKE